MRTTIQMIADKAGTSRGTVDRVINNRPNVRPEVRERILEAMRELQYVPNKAARALAYTKNSWKIGVVMPDWGGFFKEEIQRGLAAGTKTVRDYGIDVLVRQYETEDIGECISQIDELVREGISGLCVCARNHACIRDKIEELADKHIETITFNSDLEGSRRLCFVGQNLIKSGRIAAEIMTKYITPDDDVMVIVGDKGFSAHRQRLEGFCTRVTERGFRPEHILQAESHNDYDRTWQIVSNALKNPNLRGIYMANENIKACVGAIRKAGLNRKVHVICHDLSASTKKLLERGDIDFTIEQDICQQGYKPLILFENIFLDQRYPKNIEYTRINIVNAENMMH
ncbi:MAG: substrate-binding domain-containing protein [Megasphaera sp.]|nr:substrate-binding domain-containing protein [Megasphaera sp.]MCI1248780.1 substrate-binding domain-containing protein [Megasphaera sp.]